MNKQENKKLEKKVLKKLELLIPDDEPIILAFSGGPDSMFLSEILKKTGKKIYSIHIDHCIRKESSKDADFCLKHGHNPLVEKVDIPRLAKKNKRSIEQEGRIQRYSILQKVALEKKAKYILTAHHADDNVESSLLNMIRGAGLSGITGILEVTSLENQKLIRPLLNVQKKQILAYLFANEIPYLKDPSNNDNIFTRNKIRNIIIPEIEKINPNFSKTHSKNIEIYNELEDFCKDYLGKFLQKNPLPINRSAFIIEKPYIQKEIIRLVHQKITGHKENLSQENLQEVIELITKNNGNKKKKIGEIEVFLSKGQISFKKIK